MFEGENFHGFHGLKLNRKRFPVNYIPLSIGNISPQAYILP